MADDVSDNRLYAYLQRYIEKNKLYNHNLKAVRLCGHSTLPIYDAVFVVTDDESTRYSTLIRCHSAWSCPYCSPRVMADKGADIACAIDALATWYKQRAAMITFTLPHDKYMSCADSYEILMGTWRMFSRAGKTKSQTKKYTLKSDVNRENSSFGKTYESTAYRTSKRTGNRIKNGTVKNKSTVGQFDKRAVGHAGEEREYIINKDPWATVRVDLGLEHFVKVYEFTYGENGWHPHIHMLAWFPEKNLQRLTEHEDKLLDRWWHCAKFQALKYYKKKYPDKVDYYKERIETVYADYKKAPTDGHRSVYISKDKNGRVIPQESSHYITGWSGNMELTGSCNAKHAQNGHYTPFQMVEMACANAASESKWMPLFIEYATTVFKHRRVEWSSQSGIGKIIAKWKESEEYVRTLKKKVTETGVRPWKVVTWFSKQQWYVLCDWDITTDEAIRETILELARAPDAWQKIAEFVWRFGVRANMHEHRSQHEFEKGIYENKILEKMNAA